MSEATRVRGLNCPQCGAAITLRTGELAQTVACSSCTAILDARDENLRILQAHQQKLTVKLAIPLGTRGTLKGEALEVVGFQVRSVSVEGIDYSWREYLLWNPYKGFRYLSEYDGHWNVVTMVKGKPRVDSDTHPTRAVYHDQEFRHFQGAVATTRFVLGEFPWEVRVGDRVTTDDFVAPPLLLSREKTAEEETWSIGTYTSPGAIWEAFKLEGAPRAPIGLFANQPSPYRSPSEIWAIFGVLAAVVLALLVLRAATSQRAEVFSGRYVFAPGRSDSAAFVTPSFAISGRTSNVEVSIESDVSNQWAYFNLALIEEQTGTAYDFGREVSYYSGYDGGEHWSEGSTSDRSLLPRVPAGRYFLRVQPEGDPTNRGVIGYRIRLRRDVPRPSYYFIALLLLVVPPVVVSVRRSAFEAKRWQESDHPPASSE